MLKLVNITGAREQLTSGWNINYIIRFTVSPLAKARFEAFMRRKLSTFSLEPKFEMIQKIVHMNKARDPIICVPESNEAVGKRFVTDYEDVEDEPTGDEGEL